MSASRGLLGRSSSKRKMQIRIGQVDQKKFEGYAHDLDKEQQQGLKIAMKDIWEEINAQSRMYMETHVFARMASPGALDSQTKMISDMRRQFRVRKSDPGAEHRITIHANHGMLYAREHGETEQGDDYFRAKPGKAMAIPLAALDFGTWNQTRYRDMKHKQRTRDSAKGRPVSDAKSYAWERQNEFLFVKKARIAKRPFMHGLDDIIVKAIERYFGQKIDITEEAMG